MQNKITLVLDLDETLVHSSFTPVPLVDMLIDIELDAQMHTVYVRKRPYVEEFLHRMSEIFEVVVLTASLEVYADPVLDELDYDNYWVHHRLFRDSCANLNGNYIKDLSYLGRPLHQTIIIDNSPTSYLFQPRNAIPISSWYDDPTDTELRELVPVLERAAATDNVYPVLDSYRQSQANGERWR
jgi:RNA polymerase II subunit A small phosphatase-like protein